MLSAPPSFTRRRNEDVGRQDAQKMQADDDGKGGCEKEGAGLILFPADALGGGLKERRRASRGTKKKKDKVKELRVRMPQPRAGSGKGILG